MSSSNDEAYSMIDRLRGWIDDANATMSANREKIARLEEASSLLKQEYENSERTKSELTNYDYYADYLWSGNKRNDYDSKKEDAATKADTFDDAILTARQSIETKKSELSASNFDLAGCVESWGSQIGDWWGKITN
jgi:hypothetical protein